MNHRGQMPLFCLLIIERFYADGCFGEIESGQHPFFVFDNQFETADDDRVPRIDFFPGNLDAIDVCAVRAAAILNPVGVVFTPERAVLPRNDV